MKDILLVEDNIELAGLVQTFLEKEGYATKHVTNGEDAIAYLTTQKVKVILLDVNLPGMDGFAVCRWIRERQNLPVLVISARTGKEDKLNGYELGADDYIEKPVDIDILIAKIKALIQRNYGVEKHSDIMMSGSIEIHTDARQAYLNGRNLELNVKEYELLLLLAKNPGKTLHKDYLFGEIWGMDSFSENQTLTVHVKMLRKKIEEDPKNPKRIQTVWGVGYRYEEI